MRINAPSPIRLAARATACSILEQQRSRTSTSQPWNTKEGVDMNSGKLKIVLQSASAVTVLSVLVSIVGAGTKWMA